MKRSFVFLMVACMVMIAVSCDKTKSYTKMLKANDKAISRLIDEEDFEILSDFPADTVFKPNQFVKLKSGAYLNIIDRGNSERAVLNKTKIYVRFEVRGLIAPDTATVNTLDGPYDELCEFTYGDYSSFQSGSIEYSYVSEAVGAPLEYVGTGARVKLIVPFKVGSQMDQSGGNPRYYSNLRYKFEIEPD